MDEHDRFMCRARAKWRAKLTMSQSLWGLPYWDMTQTEDHHIARRKYGDTTIAVPIPLHRELTRRQMEEHPSEGADPCDPSERQGRHDLGYVDILECVADVLRLRGEGLIKALNRPDLESGESDYVQPLLEKLLLFVLHGLSEPDEASLTE